MNETELDAMRANTLRRVDRARSNFWVLFGLTGLCELVLLVALLYHVDWGNDLHRVILLATFLVYWTLGLAVIALGAYTRWWALKIVQAVQLGPEDDPRTIPEIEGPA